MVVAVMVDKEREAGACRLVEMNLPVKTSRGHLRRLRGLGVFCGGGELW